MIKVYVDQLNSNKTLGIATNQTMLLRNADTLGPFLKGQPIKPDIIFAAGRYVGSIMIDKNQQLGMSFVDCQKNKSHAEMVASHFQSEETRRLFMKVFYEVTKNYKQNYNQVELVLDTSFPPDMSAN